MAKCRMQLLTKNANKILGDKKQGYVMYVAAKIAPLLNANVMICLGQASSLCD